MEAIARALLEGEPRFVSEFLFLLSVALKLEFNVDEIGRGDKAYLLDVYIGPQNKRHLVIYIGIGNTRAQITRLVRVDYTLPVPGTGATLFGGVAGQIMPAAGPTYRYFGEHNVDAFVDVDSAIAADVAASAALGSRDLIQPWGAEIARLEALQAADKAELAGLGAPEVEPPPPAVESPAVKRLRTRLRAIHNALYYWHEIHPQVLIQIDNAGIIAPGVASPRSPPPRPLRRYQLRRVTPNVHPLAASRSSNRARSARRTHRRAAAAAAAAAAPVRNRSHRRPRTLTGKRYRRRQGYSDPRATTTNRTESPSPIPQGRRSGYEGNSNSTRRTSTPPPIQPGNLGAGVIPNLF